MRKADKNTQDIDFVISKLGEVIGFAINEAVSEEVDNY